MERSIPQGGGDVENDSAYLPNDAQVASDTKAAGDPRRERADGVITTLMNGVTTWHGARASTRGMRTRAVRHRFLDKSDADQPTSASSCNCRRQIVVHYVRDAIAVAVDRQKENADRRDRKNMEKFAVGNRVLLSMTGIQPILVTNLDANKLAPSVAATHERPVLAPLRRLTLRHSATQLLVLTLQHFKAAGEAIETLRDLSVLPVIALRLSAMALRLLSTVGVMVGILWRLSRSTTTLMLPRGRVAVFVTATAPYRSIVNTLCVGLGQCRIAGSRTRFFSRTFRTV
ncbi:hypothetical protein PF001_g10148 [Phytophthora fragariae]|uniref:Uncharacterized protein n=1 Tax=Phytophthora fragariae TaxID=53985 RepID=A0A6A4DPR9_9STRA|nr:hypothetical protein PF001_g10148 [Phytophthora fragariae]